MAQLQLQPTQNKKPRYVKHSLRIDMTPLVDLGFLLITFFIFTTTMAESTAMKLIVPADATNINVNKAPESATITVLLGKDDKAYIYNGTWQDAIKSNAIKQTNYNIITGLGSFVRAKQQWLNEHNKDGKNALIYLIKPAETATYQNLVDALDEVAINNIHHYVLSPLSKEEQAYMQDK